MVWAVWQSTGRSSSKLWRKMLLLASWPSSQLQIQGTAATFSAATFAESFAQSSSSIHPAHMLSIDDCHADGSITIV
jgi:hypothetical protein